MSKLGIVEDTLFVPMLGRIYASERYPQVLYDQKALELKKKLPSDLLEYGSQNQYTLLASATRSANMDRYIRSFLQRRPNGVIAQLGCGLETAYYRSDNGGGHAGMPWICPMSSNTGKNCCQNRSGKPILPGMPLLRTGSGKSARMCLMLPFW